jgi:hypothetical protein
MLSRIPFLSIPDRGIHNPGSNNNKRGRGERLVVSPLFVNLKFHRIENYLIFEKAQKKNLSQLTKNY